MSNVPGYDVITGKPFYDPLTGRISRCPPSCEDEVWVLEDRGWSETVTLQAGVDFTPEPSVTPATTEPAWNRVVKFNDLTTTYGSTHQWTPEGYEKHAFDAGLKQYGNALLIGNPTSPTCIGVDCHDGKPRFTLNIYVQTDSGTNVGLIFSGYKTPGTGVGPKGSYTNNLAYAPASITVS